MDVAAVKSVATVFFSLKIIKITTVGAQLAKSVELVTHICSGPGLSPTCGPLLDVVPSLSASLSCLPSAVSVN